MQNTIDRQILLLHQEGYSIRQIASELEITKYTVERTLKYKTQTSIQTASDALIQTTPDDSQTPSDDARTGYEISSDDEQTLYSDTNAQEEPPQIEQNNAPAFDNRLLLLFTLSNFRQSYVEFLRGIDNFLTDPLGSEELAISSIRSRQRYIDDFIRKAKITCGEFNQNYNSLFMSFVLDTLYMHLEQKPEMERGNRGLNFKENPRINLLLRKARSSDVFELKEDYKVYFPEIT